MEGYREINSDDVLSWVTVEHTHKKKTSDWYWVVSIVTLVFVLLSFYLENFTFGLVLILGVVVLFLQSDRDPERLSVEMNNKGIIVNKNLYSYEDIESFDIEDDFGVPRILLKSHKIFMPLIVIPFGGEIHRDDIEHFLGYYLDQEQLKESTFQIILESLGF